ncbi:uncharacterized protein BT62DRAFT_931250, partial [Guyanagaster necrorhizus]
QEMDLDSESKHEDADDDDDEAMDISDDDNDEGMDVDNGDRARVDGDESGNGADDETSCVDDSDDFDEEDFLYEGDDSDSDESQCTIPATPTSKAQIVDFAIIVTMSKKATIGKTHQHRAWSKVTSQSVPFIAEIKRFPSRRIAVNDLREEIALNISYACDQVILHALLVTNITRYTRVAPRWSQMVKLESAASNARMKEFGRRIYRSISG